MDADELDLFGRSLRDAATRPGDVGPGGTLDGALEDLGWDDALEDDPRGAISVLFGVQGETGATSSALGRVLSSGLGLADPPGGWAATVLPPAGSATPPGVLDGDALRIDGLAFTGLTGLPSARIVAMAADGTTSAHAVATDSLAVEPVDGVDPGYGLLRVTGDVGAGHGADRLPSGAWDAAVGLACLAVARELVGCSRAMLDLACEHAKGRVQFARPIASFQAVRHRLAETLVAVDMAEAMLDAAWLDPTPAATSMAKAVAGRQARTAARHGQQVLAGIGFTVEHPFHRYVRRTLVLDALLGTSASRTTALGARLLEGRQLPPLLPL